MSPGGKETARRNLDDFTRRASQFDREVRAEEAALLAEAISGSGFGPGCVAVDMGAGAGASARPFLQAGGRVVGVDLTPAMAQKAVKRLAEEGFGGRALFTVAPAERPPIREGAADATLCRNVFHHFENPRAVLGEMARAVRPGGHVFVIDYYDPEDAAQRKILNRIEYLRVSSHVRTLSLGEFRQIYEAAELHLLDPVTLTAPGQFADWMKGGDASPENHAAILDEMENLRAAGGGWWEVEGEGGAMMFTRKRVILVGRKE